MTESMAALAFAKARVEPIPKLKRFDEFPEYVALQAQVGKLRAAQKRAEEQADEMEETRRLRPRVPAATVEKLLATDDPSAVDVGTKSVLSARESLEAVRRQADAMRAAAEEGERRLAEMRRKIVRQQKPAVMAWRAARAVEAARLMCEAARLAALDAKAADAIGEAFGADEVGETFRPFFLIGAPGFEGSSDLSRHLSRLVELEALTGDEPWAAAAMGK